MERHAGAVQVTAEEIVLRHGPGPRVRAADPQYAWPLLSDVVGCGDVGEAREPQADRSVRGPRWVWCTWRASPPVAARPGRGSWHSVDPRQPRRRASPSPVRANGIDGDDRRTRGTRRATVLEKKCSAEAAGLRRRGLIVHGNDFQPPQRSPYARCRTRHARGAVVSITTWSTRGVATYSSTATGSTPPVDLDTGVRRRRDGFGDLWADRRARHPRTLRTRSSASSPSRRRPPSCPSRPDRRGRWQRR